MKGASMYTENSGQDQDQLVERCAPLVKRIAFHLVSRLPPSVQADDLIQSGMIGLLEASRNYDPSQGASFETYAGIRIRGAMLDEVRKNNWAPRTLNRKMRAITDATASIEAEQGRDARDVEIANRVGIGLEEYHRILRDANGRTVFGFDDLVSGGESISEGFGEGIAGPMEELETDESKRCVAEALSGLPERERLVMALYYYEELNLREIGAVLDVSESRICQIHSQAVIRLQTRLSGQRGEQADNADRVTGERSPARARRRTKTRPSEDGSSEDSSQKPKSTMLSRRR